ncbi:diaminopimelate epimerase [Brevundimonas sp.]|uniref:diaminopimelate epimerase n=1 Tax=Brevundimonas sp. TaxID=1871086 RepID=UPI003AF462DE
MTATSLPYVKMNGAGNDFIILRVDAPGFDLSSDTVRRLCGRDTGPGCDQLIVIEPPSGPDETAFMRVWNADGGKVETCGNALRCVGWLLLEASGQESAVIGTLGGPTVARRADGTRIEVDMGAPRLDWQQIPLAEEMDTRGIELQVGPVDAPLIHTPGAVSMGNPHVVFFTDRQDDEFVRGAGSLIEHHPLFPEGVNVGFAHVLSPDLIRLRVWERGAGLTLACGTGACAALVAAHRRGLTGRSATLELDGGALDIRWDEAGGHVFMTGPVVFEGTGTVTL